MNTLVNLNVHNTEAILASFAHKQQAGDWEDVKELKGKLEEGREGKLLLGHYKGGTMHLVKCQSLCEQ